MSAWAAASRHRLVLASASPRRAALLRQIGLVPEIRVPTVDETPDAAESPATLVGRLADLKARTVADALDRSTDADARQRLVIAADTVIDLDGETLGKPRDRADAVRMLLRLGGRVHRVWSGVTVIGERDRACACVGTEVRLCPLSETMADAYWRTGEPRDKAGGYAVQGIGAMFVESLNGSYSNVVGLPLFETLGLLRRLGLDWPPSD